MLRLTLWLGLFVALSGCASTSSTFFNRPVVEDRVGDVMHTVSLSADRRTVIVIRPDIDKPKFCAEPPPDTATALKTDLDSTLKYQGQELGIKDKIDTTVTVLASRNAPLDAFRTGMFALCQFYLNGAIDQKDIKPLFDKLLQVFSETQKVVNEAPKKQTSPQASADAVPDSMTSGKKLSTAIETPVSPPVN